MIFPESERVVYAVDTIEEAICQLRFPEILAIGSDSPTSFQEAIRDEYPIYSRQEGMGAPQDAPPEVAEIFAQFQMPGTQSVRHHFSTADESRTVTLTPQFVAIRERSYTEWRSLRKEIERAMDAVQEIYRPAFYIRTGLRYQDVLDREEFGLAEKRWSELLTPAIAGYLGGASQERIEDCVREVETTVVFQDNAAEETYVRLHHGLIERGEQPGNLMYLIDGDYHTLRRLEGGAVLGVLDELNHEAGNLFRWSTSEQLRDALGVRGDQPPP